MSIVIIAGISVSFFLLSLILAKKEKLAADKFLLLYLSYFVVSQLYFYIESLGLLEHSPWMLLGKGLYLFSGPLFFYYVHTLTTAHAPRPRIYLITLTPVLLYTANFFYYYAVGFEGKDILITQGLLYVDGTLPVTWTFFVILFIINDPLYLIWFYVLLRRYRKNLTDAVSNTDRINLNWLNTLFYLWAIAAVILFPVFALSIGQTWFNAPWITLMLQLDYLLFIFLMGFYGFRQTAVFHNASGDTTARFPEKKSPQYERSGLSSEQAASYHQQLLQYMKSHKPYLDGEITAQGLSSQLGMSVNHLSQVINQREGKNFFDFINAYRIEEVKRKLTDPKSGHLTLLAIGLESGFNSKTSFNTVFKKLTGLTPSQYHKSVKG